jgi:hypothetical protein
MQAESPAGPSGASGWETMQVAAGPERALSVMLLPDAGASLRYALLEVPLLWRPAPQQPAFSITLLLRRMPLPDEEYIAPLILSGTLTFEVSLAVPAGAVHHLARTLDTEIRPLYVRSAAFSLHATAGTVPQLLGSASASGTGIRAAFSTALDRNQALDVLNALDGSPSGIRLDTEVTYRAAAAASSLLIRQSWSAIYDYLLRRCDDAREMALDETRAALRQMLDDGVLPVFGVSANGDETPMAAPQDPGLADGLLRVIAVIAERIAGDRLRLKDSPPSGMMLEYSQRISGEQQVIRLSSMLNDILNGALDQLDRSRFIHLVCPDGALGNGGVSSPRRLRSAAHARAAGNGHALELSAMDGSLKSVALAMRPTVAPLSVPALLHSDIARIQPLTAAGMNRITHHAWLNDAILEGVGASQLRRLPIVDAPDAPFWRDRVDTGVRWYAPAFELLRPAAGMDAATSPFAFSFHRVGTTDDGKPALAGTVRFTLRQRMSAATSAALKTAAGATPRPVVMQGLSVSLSIPYVDRQSGALRRSMLRATLAQNADNIVATIDLLNDAVRLAYGSLSLPGFQSEPCQLHIAYSYEGYVPVNENTLQLVAGGKTAVTPVAHSNEQSLALGRLPHLNMANGSFQYPAGEIRLRREAPVTVAAPVDHSGARPVSSAVSGVLPGVTSHTVTAAQPVATFTPAVTAAAVNAVVISRPPISASVALHEVLRKTRYATRTLIREERLEALFSCEQLGAFYLEQGEHGPTAIGCVDSLRLGQATVRQYGEITALACPRYRVFRSLQQPGRFLVVPATYRITRYDASVAGKAYRPAIAVYSHIDVANAANNRVIYHATLQPDIPLHQRRALLSALSAEARDPVIEYPTEVPGEFEYAWTIGASVRVEPRVVKMPDSFQVMLATDLGGALLLRTMLQGGGVFGSARLKLADGTAFDLVLTVDLNQIGGPWNADPVEVTLEPGRARLTNRTERAIDVSDIAVYRDGNDAEMVAVETRLAPAAVHAVSLAGSASAAFAVYSFPPGSPAVLEEIRSFVEDIHTNVLFIDLVNYANHGLTRLDIEARIKNVAGTQNVNMQGDPARGAVDFLLPLTTYLSNHILQFRVKKIFQAAAPQTTPWLEWDLETNGNVVSLTWQLID